MAPESGAIRLMLLLVIQNSTMPTNGNQSQSIQTAALSPSVLQTTSQLIMPSSKNRFKHTNQPFILRNFTLKNLKLANQLQERRELAASSWRHSNQEDGDLMVSASEPVSKQHNLSKKRTAIFSLDTRTFPTDDRYNLLKKPIRRVASNTKTSLNTIPPMKRTFIDQNATNLLSDVWGAKSVTRDSDSLESVANNLPHAELTYRVEQKNGNSSYNNEDYRDHKSTKPSNSRRLPADHAHRTSHMKKPHSSKNLSKLKGSFGGGGASVGEVVMEAARRQGGIPTILLDNGQIESGKILFEKLKEPHMKFMLKTEAIDLMPLDEGKYPQATARPNQWGEKSIEINAVLQDEAIDSPGNLTELSQFAFESPNEQKSTTMTPTEAPLFSYLDTGSNNKTEMSDVDDNNISELELQQATQTTRDPRLSLSSTGKVPIVSNNGELHDRRDYPYDHDHQPVLVLRGGQRHRIKISPSSLAGPSQPQLVRLISKQKHKFDDKVMSPTLTVVDTDFNRLPSNSTSAHNNKLIVPLKPGRPRRRHPPTTQFPIYNIVGGIPIPPYNSSRNKTPYPRHPNDVYGLLRPASNSSNSGNNHTSSNGDMNSVVGGGFSHYNHSDQSSFGSLNIKFPAAEPTILQPDHIGPILPDKFNMSISDSSGYLRPSDVPQKITIAAESHRLRPSDAVVQSETQVIGRPQSHETFTNHDGIMKLKTTRKPTKRTTTPRVNIVSANTTVVTADPEQLHDVLSNVISDSHGQHNIYQHNGQNHNTNIQRPFWSTLMHYLSNAVNNGVAASTFALLTLIKTVFVALLVMFLPPMAVAAAILQIISIG